MDFGQWRGAGEKRAEATRWPLSTFFECDKASVQKSRENIPFPYGQSTSTNTMNTQPLEKPLQEYTSRYIPRGIRREVWKRDHGCCQFKNPNGGLCGEEKFLEFDHALPWALGGSSHSVDNVRILCRVHNEWTAKKYFRNWAMGGAGQRVENGYF